MPYLMSLGGKIESADVNLDLYFGGEHSTTHGSKSGTENVMSRRSIPNLIVYLQWPR